MWAWLRMLRNAPTGISCFFGTRAVSTASPRAWRRFDLALVLAGFDEAGRLRPALDLAKRLGLSPPQPRPRSYGHPAVKWLAAVRSAVPALPSGWQEPLPRSRLGWRRRVPSSGRRTTSSHAKRSQRMVAS